MPFFARLTCSDADLPNSISPATAEGANIIALFDPAMQLKGGTWWCDVNGYVGLGALRLVRHQLELVDHSAELGKRTGLHLLHRPAAMHLHRGFGDADIVGNLFAQAAARHLNYDLALPGA